MYGRRVEGDDGALYDSISEFQVMEALRDLQREKIVAGWVVHPIVGGMQCDYLVQLGSETSAPGSIVLLEYDGLLENRPHDLTPKLDRYALIAQWGIETRWLTESSYDALKECLCDYTPPHFITKKCICSCGKLVNTLTVITAREEYLTESEILFPTNCNNCDL